MGRITYIQDPDLRRRYVAIKRYLATQPNVLERSQWGLIEINESIYLAKHSSKFRIKGQIDWAYYTPKTIATAIDNNDLETYYQVMLADVRSDPNKYKDEIFEQQLKGFYAARAGRASLI